MENKLLTEYPSKTEIIQKSKSIPIAGTMQKTKPKKHKARTLNKRQYEATVIISVEARNQAEAKQKLWKILPEGFTDYTLVNIKRSPIESCEIYL